MLKFFIVFIILFHMFVHMLHTYVYICMYTYIYIYVYVIYNIYAENSIENFLPERPFKSRVSKQERTGILENEAKNYKSRRK